MHLVLRRMVVLALILTTLACSRKKDALTSAPKPIQEGTLPQIVDAPEQVLGTFMAPDLAAFLEGMERLLGKAAPVPVGATQALLLQQMIEWGFRDTTVLELRQPIYALLLDPKEFSPPWVVCVRVKSKGAFLEALQPAWKQKATADGVIELAQDQIDTYGVFKGAGAQPDTPSKNGPKGTVPQSLFVKEVGKDLLVAPSARSLKVGEPVLFKLAATLPSNISATGVVFLDHLRKSFQAEMSAVPALLDAAFKQNPVLTSAPSGDLARFMLTTVANKLLAFVQQTKQLILFSDIRPERALLQLGVVPEKDSFFEKFLAAQQPRPLTLLDALPEGHFLAAGGNVQWQMLRQDLLDIAQETLKMALQREPTKEWNDALKGVVDVVGDEMAFSENVSAAGIGLVELIAVRDEATARKVFPELITTSYAMVNDKLKPGMSAMKMKGPTSLGAYQGVELSSYEVSFEIGKDATPQTEMLKRLYGDKLLFVTAVFDKTVALTLSRKAEEDMKATIDRLRKKDKGLTASAAYRDAEGSELGKASCGAGFFSLSRMLGMGTQAVVTAMGVKPQPSVETPSGKSGLFLGVRSTPTLWTLAIRLPAKHLEEIGAAVKSIMQFSTAP